MRWSEMGRGARAYRLFHVAWSVVSLASLAQVWACALGARRGRRLAAGVAFLSVEGIGLVIGRGNCPLGPLQSRLGDPVPLFELVLPPRAAKAAVPILASVTLLGFLGVAVRSWLGTVSLRWGDPG